MNVHEMIRQTVERSHRGSSPFLKPTPPPGREGVEGRALKPRRVTEVGPGGDLSYATQELGVGVREHVFQIIEDRVGPGRMSDLSVLDPVTEAIDRFMADVNPKIAEVIEALGGVRR